MVPARGHVDRVDTTTDTLFGGALVVEQPRQGYRFNVDSLWLGAFATRGRQVAALLDLGAGVGVVTLAVHRFSGVSRATLVDKDSRMSDLADRNLTRAGIAGQSLTLDLAGGLPRALSGSHDLVVSNPPFFEPGERRPGVTGREDARAGCLEPFVQATADALDHSRSRAVFVYPARSLGRLLALAETRGLVPKRLCFVHAFASEPARVALVELRRARPGGLLVEPPIVEWSRPGTPTRSLSALTAGRASDRRRLQQRRAHSGD